MKFTHLLGTAGLVGAVALPAPVPDDSPVIVSDVPTPAVLGPGPYDYNSLFTPATVTAVVQQTPDSTLTSDNAQDSGAAQTSGVTQTSDATVTPAPTSADLAKRYTYDASIVSSACSNGNWNCCSLPTGTLPLPKATMTDTEAFKSFGVYSSLASCATARPAVPSGYSVAFSNKQASVQQPGYRGVFTLDKYSASACAAHCDADPYCQGFNIYIERDPVIRPADNLCPNPDATALIKCTIYGFPVSDSTATNVGQYQSQFHVVITASNGYNKPIKAYPQKGFNGPQGPFDGAIQDNSYYGVDVFNDGPFNATLCAERCTANTANNLAHPDPISGNSVTCNFFNAYIQYSNGQPQGTFCAYYSRNVLALSGNNVQSKATNKCQYQGANQITIGSSFTYEASAQKPARNACTNPGCDESAPSTWTGGSVCGPDVDGKGNACYLKPQDCSKVTTCACDGDCSWDEVCVTGSVCGGQVCAKNSGAENCADVSSGAALLRRALFG